MLFKNHIKIKFLTFDPYILKNLQPNNSSTKHPDWFKNTSPFNGENSMSPNLSPLKAPTIRRCPAINEYFTTGVTFPGWSDMEFFIDGPKKHIEWHYSNNYPNMELVQPHNASQYPHLADKYIHVKIISPWIAESNSDIKWFLTKPSYFSEFDDQEVIFCDGITRFDINFVMHVNLFFPIKNYTYITKFSAGQPFQKYIPLTEKPINIITEYCDIQYYELASLQGRKISYHLGKFYNLLRSKQSKEN
jgi:hypothetical protein